LADRLNQIIQFLADCTNGHGRGGSVSVFCVGVGFRFFGRFLADRTYGRAIATLLRPSSSSSVTLCIVAKRCVL